MIVYIICFIIGFIIGCIIKIPKLNINNPFITNYTLPRDNSSQWTSEEIKYK